MKTLLLASILLTALGCGNKEDTATPIATPVIASIPGTYKGEFQVYTPFNGKKGVQPIIATVKATNDPKIFTLDCTYFSGTIQLKELNTDNAYNFTQIGTPNPSSYILGTGDISPSRFTLKTETTPVTLPAQQITITGTRQP